MEELITRFNTEDSGVRGEKTGVTTEDTENTERKL